MAQDPSDPSRNSPPEEPPVQILKTGVTLADLFQKYTMPIIISAILFSSFLYDKYQAQERELTLVTQIRTEQVELARTLSSVRSEVSTNQAKLDALLAQISVSIRQHDDAAKDANMTRIEHFRRLDELEKELEALNKLHLTPGGLR